MIYAAARKGVDAGFAKLSDFADEAGRSTSEISLRLRHAEDSKGYPQLAPLDFLAHLAMRAGALETFLDEIEREKNRRAIPLRPPTAEETARALAAEMTAKQRRALEREKGWPEGWLDR